MENKKPNRLIHSLSPYLRQHAYNPVDWYEWGEEAFARAESENKLMLVSIGYSACHWCHVMAHESFEDPETAAIMNKLFVCIKIDREELPDIDHLYMDACQLINGNGGWPLNAFALPDKRPLHALTYAPKAKWIQLLENLGNLWNRNPSTAYEYAEKLSHGIRNMSLPPELLPQQTVIQCTDEALEAFKGYYDSVFGGSKRAPKFPMPSNWYFLLQYGQMKSSEEASSMALHTLEQMALGGIYDPVGGGFARYSVDEKWFAPHFEKMLYDNAQLLGVYSYAYALSGDAQFRHTALQTAAFCKSQWLTPAGVYQSALDADSDGGEGFYYTYTYQELKLLLGNDADVFAAYYQCSEAGNWEHGRNILYASGKPEEAAEQLQIPPAQLGAISTRCLHTLLQYRTTRTPPGTDDKCICAWNALLLKHLAEASVYLQAPDLLVQATALAEAMLNTFETPEGLMRISKNGSLKINAYLEDYATLTDALIALYRCTLNEHYLHKAHILCKKSIALFYRKPTGFFAFSSKPAAIAEKFDTADDVIPSGNSIMAHNLYTLSWYYNLPEWKLMAESMCMAMQELIKTSAPWYSNWAALALKLENSCKQYVYSGPSATVFAHEVRNRYNKPDALLGYIGAYSEIPLFKGKEYNGKNRVFKCIDMQCLQPVEL